MATSQRAIRIDVPNGQRTLVVVGCGRGGTSLVAGAASILRIPMGTPDDSLNHEDVELVNLAQGRDLNGDLTGESPDCNFEKFRRLIRARNEQNDLWGWKDPSADLYLEAIADLLRNPLVLFVNRDMVAIAQSEFNQTQTSIEQAYEMALLRFGRYWAILQKLQWPTLLVSYERAALNPEALLREIADFVGLEPPDAEQREMVRIFGSSRNYRLIGKPSGYRT